MSVEERQIAWRATVARVSTQAVHNRLRMQSKKLGRRPASSWAHPVDTGAVLVHQHVSFPLQQQSAPLQKCGMVYNSFLDDRESQGGIKNGCRT
jgi:hypothetical protein